MSDNLRHRFFAVEEAFQEPITFGAVCIIAAVLVVSRAAIFALRRAGRIPDQPYRDVLARWRSWLFLSVILFAPILLGTAWVMAAVCLLSLLCYQEFARATGLFREKALSLAVLFGIGLVTFAVVDNYARLFFASAALTVGLIAIITIPQDRPKGYIQRTALGVLGFLLFGYCFGYIGYFANSHLYRGILILLLMGTELNDVFAFCCGKLIGGPKAIPHTSPGKTWAGCLGALVLTTAFVMTLGHFVFKDTDVDRFVPLLILGSGLSILGQFGDLLLSSIKRDVGIKDIGSVIPGHGGLLDRFDSLVLVPPAAFHYLSLYLGPIGMDKLDQAHRVLTGG
jgi:phosphatidate cytidylyltransferase